MPDTLASTGSVSQWVIDSIENIPSSVNSGTNIKDFIELAAYDVTNYTGEAISKTNVPTQYQGILFNLGKAYALSKMIGVGVDFNASIGEFSVNKGAGDSNTAQIDIALKMANNSIASVGKQIRYGRTY